MDCRVAQGAYTARAPSSLRQRLRRTGSKDVEKSEFSSNSKQARTSIFRQFLDRVRVTLVDLILILVRLSEL